MGWNSPLLGPRGLKFPCNQHISCFHKCHGATAAAAAGGATDVPDSCLSSSIWKALIYLQVVSRVASSSSSLFLLWVLLFLNFTSTTGYAINAHGPVGSTAGHEDSYVPNPQAAQSLHMQFQGRHHPSQQPATIASPHHLGPTIGGNVGVGVVAAPVPGAQVGVCHQQQLGHLNWIGNF